MRLSISVARPIFVVLSLIYGSLANTEIRNLKVGLQPGVNTEGWSQNWPVLDPRAAERLLVLEVGSPLPEDDPTKRGLEDDSWAVLDFDDPAWSSYDSFTVKVSNPASVPVDIDLELLTPLALAARLGNTSTVKRTGLSSTRKEYVHITSKLSSVASPLHAEKTMTIRFNLAVEPILLGAVPLSVIPLVAFIPVLLLLVHLVTSYFVCPMLDALVADARAAIDAQDKKK